MPVTLSADKKTVVSYPDPTDIKTGSGPANSGPLPVLLHKGYLLDKRGVDKNTAFIKMTYSEYAALKLPPSPTALYGMIIDKNPLTALYDCGPRDPVKNDVQQLEAAIDHHQLHKRFKQIK